MRPSVALVILLAVAWGGCTCTRSELPDGGAEAQDAGHPADAGRPDAGSPDGGPDSGVADSGTPDAGPWDGGFAFGEPLTGADAGWSWVSFPNAYCANGSTTGIGVNLTTASSRVLIYLEGGGACWSELTCFELQTAAYFTSGYSESDFMAEARSTGFLAEPGGFFDRTAAANPFKDDNYVFVPYCTGDIHGGNNRVEYPGDGGVRNAWFVGYPDMTAFLDRIVPTFPSAERVVLAGSSGGGFGAIYNWWQTQAAFGSIPIMMIDDSGTFMPEDIEADVDGGTSHYQGSTWGLKSTLPPGCTECSSEGLAALYGYYERAFPGQRGALLSYTMDDVLPSYSGVTEAEFTMGLDEDLSDYFTASSNLHSFTVDATGHTLWFSPQLTPSTGSPTLQTWVTQMVTDSPSWSNAGP